jgi:hypothetical protein
MKTAKLIVLAAAAVLFFAFQPAQAGTTACSDAHYWMVFDCFPGCPGGMTTAQVAAAMQMPETTVKACFKMLKDNGMVWPADNGGVCRATG